MRKLVVSTFLTLDGVMQAPGGPEEDPTGGFEHGGWSVNYWDDDMGAWMGKAFASKFDLLLGRKTYEIFAAHWPHARDEPGAAELNSARKYVASRTLDSVEWENSTLLQGDVAEAVAALRQEDDGDVHVIGSTVLVQTLIEHDLVDELRLMIDPVALGGGKRIFRDDGVLRSLRLVDSQATRTGAILATYAPAES
jgi:dihydrofolate reductase